VRSVKTGTPLATSSLRKSRLYCPPVLLWPSATYILVLLMGGGSSVTAISGRVVVIAEFSDALICAQVAPPSFDRHTPRA